MCSKCVFLGLGMEWGDILSGVAGCIPFTASNLILLNLSLYTETPDALNSLADQCIAYVKVY